MKGNGRIKARKKLKECRRERRKKIFKGLGRLILILSLIVGLALAGKKVEDFLLRSPFFQIKEVNFKGATCLGQEVLENSANIELGKNIFRINLKAIQERLERHPKVREAAVSRGFPNAVTVDIKEREAVALFEIGGETYPVDGEGVMLARLGRPGPVSPPAVGHGNALPLVTGLWPALPHRKGLNENELKVGEELQWPKLTLLLDVLETLTSSGLKISEMDLRPEGVVLRYKGTRVLFGELNKETRAEELKLILSDLAERKEEAKYIDLRFTRPVVKLK